MKIGILSMQKVVNYGSFMQAYGLRKLIKQAINQNAEFIDIIPGEKISEVQISKKQRFKNISKAIKQGLFLEKIIDNVYMKNLARQFNKDFFPLFDFSDNSKENFSTVVIGSDEVFNCTQNAPWGFSTHLLGDVKNSENVISYAASFGATSIEKIESLSIREDVIENLKKINKISVRDYNSVKILKNLLNIEPEIFLDPVLLSDFTEEVENSNEISEKKKYMIVYSYTGRITDKKEIAKIKEFAKSKDLKIFTIFCRYKWADKKIIPDSPFQMLRYFKNAEYVVSDTFHGSIFSIITHRKFCTLLRDSNTEKMFSLLKMLGLEKRAIENPENIFDVLEEEIDYTEVDKVRDYERNRTINFLRQNIK